MKGEATVRQIGFLTGLFIDCSFDRKQRNAFLSEEFGRTIDALDELNIAEASRIIDFLLRLKEQKKFQS